MERAESFEDSLQIVSGTECLEGLVQKPRVLHVDSSSAISKIRKLEDSDRKEALELGLVPKSYAGCSFDRDRVLENIKYFYTDFGYGIKNFDNYLQVVNTILSSIRKGELPAKSWLIGAPNNFGKTSFAQECVMLMHLNGWRVVPYTSLFEIGVAMAASSKLVLKPYIAQQVKQVNPNEGTPTTHLRWAELSEYIKKPEAISGRFSYSEFLNADCLICYMSSIENREVESRVLYTVLSTRAAKGLPTVVMMQSSMDIYLNNDTIGKNIWSEIYSKRMVPDGCYDRLVHVSCYKVSRGVM